MSEELIERLRMEAQIHAQEARTANATIAEIYQLCSGGNGEPGNWHGAEPVRALIAERDALATTLRQQAGRVDVRAAVQRMAGMLEQGEWADLLSTDPDVARLNAAISAALAQNTQGKARCGSCGDVIKPDRLTGTTCACAHAGRTRVPDADAQDAKRWRYVYANSMVMRDIGGLYHGDVEYPTAEEIDAEIAAAPSQRAEVDRG